MVWVAWIGAAVAGPLDGRWTLADDDAAVAARVDAAVEAAIAPYNVAIRTIARPRVRAAATWCPSYELGAQEASFALQCGAAARIEAPFSAVSTPIVGADGKRFTVAASRDGDRVELLFHGEEGWQRTRYTPQADGTLRVDKTLHADRLDADVSWTMTYRRAP